MFRIRFILPVVAVCLSAHILSAAGVQPFGVCEHPTFSTRFANSHTQMLDAVSVGLSALRTDFHWTALGANRNPGQPFNFTVFDRVVDLAADCGVQLLPILTAAPVYAHPLHEHLDMWTNYVAQTVNRFRTRLPFWEVWNEHNFENEKLWGRKSEHPARYVHLLRETCRTIRSIDPNLKVLYGGTAHVPMDYLERTFQAGAGDWFDILCIHPYGQSLLPEEFIPYQMLRLRELMKKYHLEHKEIWATEIGWPTGTVPKPWIYQAILPRAFSSCGIDPAKAVIGVIRDLDNGFCVSSPCFSLLDSFPAFHRVREVSFSELATLSVSECPVLVPCAEEIFPTSYHGDLVEYVKRGGTILLPEGIPFGYDHPTLSEGCAPAPKSIQRALHISVNGYWSMGIQETTEIEIPGFTPPDQRMKKQARFLSDRNLSGSDRFIPLAFGVDANGKRYPFAGVYRLNSDLKGNVIVMASRSACTRHEISRTWQGMILPRAYLTLLAEGVSRVYWYKLTSSGEDDCGNQERNFGIMAVERKPKPAFLACRVLTEECPVGSTIPRITRNGDVFFASWTRPDGKKKCAVWSLEKAVQTSLSSTPIAARSHLGEELAVTGRTILASPAIVYYTCL